MNVKQIGVCDECRGSRTLFHYDFGLWLCEECLWVDKEKLEAGAGRRR